MRVALCQIGVVDSDIQGNLTRIESAAEQARAAGAEIACFPETALIGWGNAAAVDLAQPIPGSQSERLCGLAARTALMLCIGLHERDGGCLYNSALLIDSNGKVLYRHRKINLIPDVEAPPTQAGPADGLWAVPTRFGRIGLMICADSFLTAHREILRVQKPDIVLIPYAWAAPSHAWPGHGERLRAMIAVNARDIGCPVVGTDGVGVMTGGPWKDYVVGGCSAAYLSDGTPLVQLPYGEDAVQLAAIQ